MKKLLGLIFLFVYTSTLIEIGCFLLAKSRYLPLRTPDYHYELHSEPFWADINPYFGVWHLSKRFHHQTECFDVIYRANSYRARDKERTIHSDHSRVVVLGDSFIEGWGVESQDRLTDLLEKDTGKEFLNFGTAGSFGPTQYYLLYKYLAKKFDHEAILIGILPDNDFIEDDLEIGKKIYPDFYRPYWVGTYPHFKLSYYLENIDDSTRSIKYIRKTYDAPTRKAMIAEFFKVVYLRLQCL
jgi:hypothetical protein